MRKTSDKEEASLPNEKKPTLKQSITQLTIQSKRKGLIIDSSSEKLELALSGRNSKIMLRFVSVTITI